MATATPALEPAEAVIISGPRKGEFITISDDDLAVSPGAEALLDEMIATANNIAETIRAMRRDAEAFHAEMRERKKERDELIRAVGRAYQVAA
jgi:hypothetical protein